MFLDMSERAIILYCESEKIGISAISKLPTGGIRLVCMSVRGAENIRRGLKAKIMKDDHARQQHGPGWGFVIRN